MSLIAKRPGLLIAKQREQRDEDGVWYQQLQPLERHALQPIEYRACFGAPVRTDQLPDDRSAGVLEEGSNFVTVRAHESFVLRPRAFDDFESRLRERQRAFLGQSRAGMGALHSGIDIQVSARAHTCDAREALPVREPREVNAESERVSNAATTYQ